MVQFPTDIYSYICTYTSSELKKVFNHGSALIAMVHRRKVLKASGSMAVATVAGCLNLSGESSSDDGSSSGNEEVEITIQAGAPGTSYYAISAPFGQILSEHASNPPIDATVMGTGGGVENVKAVTKNVDLAASMGSVVNKGYNGEGGFDKAYDNVRLIMRGEKFPPLYVVRKGSGIESLKDLEGKRVAAGPNGSGLANQHPEIMGLFGIQTEQKYMSHSDGQSALVDGDIDAWYVFLGSSVQNAFSTADLNVLSLTDNTLEKITSEISALDTMEVTPDRLTGLESTVNVFGEGTWWITTAEYDASVITHICETVLKHPEGIRENNVNSKNFGKEFAYYDMGVPYHKGAEEYFKS